MTAGPAAPTRDRVLVDVPAPSVPTPVRIGVVADPHVSTRGTGTWKVYHRTEALLARAVDRLAALDADRVLVAGDLTRDGEPHNFDRFDELVAALPAPTAVIPGNHDVPKSFLDHAVPPVAAFADRYTRDGLPFAVRVGDVTLACLDSATLPDGSLRDTWGGAVSDAQLDWLDGVLAEASTPVVAVHHNLYPLPEHDGDPWTNFPLRNAGALHDVLAAHDVRLVVSGHHHLPATTSRDGVREVVVPAVCSFPHAAATVDVGPEGTRVTIRALATPPAAVEGYALAAAGDPLGYGVVSMAETRLRRLPLVER